MFRRIFSKVRIFYLFIDLEHCFEKKYGTCILLKWDFSHPKNRLAEKTFQS